tara:strand:- start:162 stop:668 length:507 start_codon:yes stop_codon:yes gene_type:complete
MNFFWSVWLVPHSNIIGRYTDLVGHFSKKYDSPIFQPHITLFGGVNINPDKTFSFFNSISQDYGYFHLTPTKIVADVPPWKSLVISFNPDKSLQKMQKKIQNKLQGIKKYIFDPHLSLVYGNIKIKKSDYKCISLDESICFSDVSLVVTSDNIDRWKVIRTFNLKNTN